MRIGKTDKKLLELRYSRHDPTAFVRAAQISNFRSLQKELQRDMCVHIVANKRPQLGRRWFKFKVPQDEYKNNLQLRGGELASYRNVSDSDCFNSFKLNLPKQPRGPAPNGREGPANALNRVLPSPLSSNQSSGIKHSIVEGSHEP